MIALEQMQFRLSVLFFYSNANEDIHMKDFSVFLAVRNFYRTVLTRFLQCIASNERTSDQLKFLNYLIRLLSYSFDIYIYIFISVYQQKVL